MLGAEVEIGAIMKKNIRLVSDTGLSCKTIQSLSDEYIGLYSLASALQIRTQQDEETAGKYMSDRFTVIETLSSMPAEELSDVSRKLLIWATEGNLVNGNFETEKLEDQLVLSALQDLIKLTSEAAEKETDQRQKANFSEGL